MQLDGRNHLALLKTNNAHLSRQLHLGMGQLRNGMNIARGSGRALPSSPFVHFLAIEFPTVRVAWTDGRDAHKLGSQLRCIVITSKPFEKLLNELIDCRSHLLSSNLGQADDFVVNRQ